MMRPALFVLILCLLYPAGAIAQGIEGRVHNPEGESVPFATVYVPELHHGTIANAEGEFQLSLPPGAHRVHIQYLGYKTQILEVFVEDEYERLDILMEVQEYRLPPVTVTASGEDPAYYFMRRAIGMSQYYLNQVSAYSCRVYLKGSGVVKNMPGLMRRQLEREGIEEGRYFVTETISDVHFELPDKTSTEVISLRSSGNDNQSSPMAFVTISFYRDINGIISPLSRNAMQVYRFELSGSFREEDELIHRIRVIPKRPGPDLYSGTIYIREGSWNLHSVDLRVAQNLFSIDIRQQYNRVADQVWMPVSQHFDVDFSLMGFDVAYQYMVSVRDYQITMNPDLDHAFYLRGMGDEDHSGFELPATPADPAIAMPQEQGLTQRQREIEKLRQAENPDNRDMRRMNRLIRREARNARRGESLELFPYETVLHDSARVRSPEYWDRNRPVPLSSEELESFGELAPDTKGTFSGEGSNTLLRQLLLGGRHRISETTMLTHNGLAGPSSFYYNTVDGIPYKKSLGLQHRPEHGRYLDLSGNVSYAFARERLLADMSLRYGYQPLRRAYIHVSGGRATADFDHRHGIPELFNAVTTLYFKQNLLKLYEKDYVGIAHRTDPFNGLVVHTGLKLAARRQLTNHSHSFITNPFGEHFTPNIPPHAGQLPKARVYDHRALTADIGLSYTHRHYYRMQNQRKVMAYSRYPTLSLFYRRGIDGLLGSDTRFTFLEASIRQGFQWQLIGQFDYHLAAGRFFETDGVFFADFRHFHTNPVWVKATNRVDMFRTLGHYARSTTNDFAVAHLRYNHHRFLVKRLPFLAGNLMRETLFVNTLFVRDHKPYWELGYGLEQLFLLFSFEVVTGFSGSRHQYTGFRLGIPLPEQLGIGF